MARGRRRSSAPSSRPGKPPTKRASLASLWRRLGPLQKWLTSILVATLATTLTGALVALFTGASHEAAQWVTPPAHVSPRQSGAVQPLAVAATLHPPDDQCTGGRGWVYPPNLPTIGAPNETTSSANVKWALQHGAMPASGNYVVLTVQGHTADVVVLEALRITVVKRASPVAGDYGGRSGTGGDVLARPSGCGGFTPRQFIVDLDRTPVKVTPVPGMDDQTGVAIPAVNFPYKVSNTDPEQFDVRVYTGQCTCDWVIDLDWVFEGRTGTTRIADQGQPFRIAATANSHGYEFNDSTKSWQPSGDCYGCTDGRPYEGPLEHPVPAPAPA
jgi:hypothetical protein